MKRSIERRVVIAVPQPLLGTIIIPMLDIVMICERKYLSRELAALRGGPEKAEQLAMLERVALRPLILITARGKKLLAEHLPKSGRCKLRGVPVSVRSEWEILLSREEHTRWWDIHRVTRMVGG